MKNPRKIFELRLKFAKHVASLIALAGCCAVMSPATAQTTISKANNTDDLNLTTSWVAGLVPGSSDRALWDSTVTGANSVSLGADLSWGGIQITNPGGPVTIGGANTLTIGSVGIDMSAATQSLTISSGLALTGGQTWNVATGQTLTTGAFSRVGAGTTLVYDRSVNTGTITASPTLTNGIVGPWVIVRNAGAAANNSASGYTFGTISGGNLTAYTGATSLTGAGAWGGIPSGGTGTVNYDLSSNGTLGATGLLRTINTLRYTGTGARQPGNTANADLFSMNGFLNAGTGTFTFGTTGNVANDRPFNVVIGANRDLVLAPMTAGITLLNTIKDNAGGASAVTIIGSGTNAVTLSGVNTYTGATSINGGTLLVNGAGSINTSSGIRVDGVDAKYVHTSSVAGTVPINLIRGTVDGTGSIGALTVADNAANIVANGNLSGTGALTVSSLSFAGDATVNLNLGAGVGLNVTGALSTTPANGSVLINATKSGWTLGNNNLIGFGSFSGAASDFSLGTVSGLGGRQVAGGLTIAGNNVALNVTGDLPVWSGASGSAWTTATTNDNAGPNNWATKTALTGTNFWTADTPEFNDTYNVGAGPVAVTNRLVDIQGANVTPGLVTFNNSTGDYTLTSTGGFGMAGAASLVKSGTSALIITNTNTYTGSTTINAGTLQIGNGTTDGSIATTSSITNNGTLAYNLSGAQTYGNVISGTGSVTKTGVGVLTLSGNNTYQGGTMINGGAITLNGAGTLGSGNITIATGATLNIDRAYTTSVAVSGGGNIVSTASNAVTGDFSGFNGTYTHNSTTTSSTFNTGLATSENAAYNIASAQGSSQGMIAAGNGDYTLKMGSLSGVANSLFRGGNTATGTTTLEIGNLNTNTTFAGSIANGVTKTIALTKVGSGTLTLSGVNSYTGPTTVNAGTLNVNGSLGNSAVTIASGATLNGTGTLGGNTTINGIHAPGNSAGVQTFAADLTYSGAASVQWELTGNTLTNAPLAFDQIIVGGNLNFAGPTTVSLDFNTASSVNWADTFWDTNKIGTGGWLMYDVAGTTTGFSNLSLIPGLWLDGTSTSLASVRSGSFFSWFQDNNDIYLNYTATAVPEPTSLALVSLAGVAVLNRLRRKRSTRVIPGN